MTTAQAFEIVIDLAKRHAREDEERDAVMIIEDFATNNIDKIVDYDISSIE